MNGIRKTLIVFCVFLLTLYSVFLTASGEDARVTYSGNTGDLIFEPGSGHSPSDLFANFKNVMPGASLTQKITVRNEADNRVKIKLYLRSLGSTDEKYNAFLNQLTLTVTKETDTPMFDTAADKTAGMTDWICLGTLYSGGSLDLNLTLDVPVTLDNLFQKQIGKIKWQFVAEEFPVEEPTWTCPENEKHSYHIEEIDGVSTYVCDDCAASEQMKCKECGGLMHEAIMILIGGKTYIVYPAGGGIYTTKDGGVSFYINQDKIIEYYVVNGTKTNVKDVSEYKLYQYYECEDNSEHHTDPLIPQTGDDFWKTVILLGGTGLLLLFLILLIGRRRKPEDEEEEEEVCRS